MTCVLGSVEDQARDGGVDVVGRAEEGRVGGFKEGAWAALQVV